ncbi:hypothetical protein IU433_23200 [Nocardia puris]|uniref:Uncharacterized protein n=1 Tax=Nocardia puris TaxID=208602 RepID=A0A366DFV0_9NOCA|nr:hypothetical protein [Nocardia puris]MBF6212073.1 hypothetical protein [Nocardia puris]MBF6367099.1 hypothetical protein [Nocardia puris]MBF6461924.1 hypothetical protein [Nocardia puris]RBO88379.1 hypothetical protein DFR74_109147 [Nocardia puris]
MTRDLPFDDDSEGAEQPGDTAYRVATGVARVARAGAYVTGGALVAANGGGVPAQPGGQRLDSWNTGWASSADPDPDVPSPVVTFPDPDPDDLPYTPDPVGAQAPAPGLQFGPAPAPEGHWNPRVDGQLRPGETENNNPYEWWDEQGSAPGYADQNPWEQTQPPVESVPGGSSPYEWWEQQGGFGLPGHGLGQAGHGFGLPGSEGFLAPGSNPFALPKIPAAGRTEETAASERSASSDREPGLDEPTNPFAQPGNSYGDMFGGVGTPADFDAPGDFGVYLGVEGSAEIWTKLEVDMGIGPDGMYLTTDLRVEASAEFAVKTAAGTDIGTQLDNFSDWLSGSRQDPATPRVGEQPGASTPGVGGGLSGSGVAPATTSATPQIAPAAQPAPHAAPAPQAVAPPVAPAAAPAPVVPAPAPVPAPVAPAPAAAAAAPVVATPLQTTIQPEAASTPIANVIGTPDVPSPLTAPAAVVPALFVDRPVKTPEPTVTPPTGSPSTPTVEPGSTAPSVPTTITQTVPTPSVPTPTKPDTDVTLTPGVTKTPGVTVPPTQGNGGGSDSTITKTPGATVTQPTGTPGGGTGNSGTGSPTTGGTGTDTGGSAGTPSVPSATADVPTVSVPTATVDVPTSAPTADVPTVDVPTATVDVPTVEVPTVAPTTVNPAPVKPPTIVEPPKPRPISDDDNLAAYHHVATAGSADHSLLAGGLSSGLLPDTIGYHQPVHTAHDADLFYRI